MGWVDEHEIQFWKWVGAGGGEGNGNGMKMENQKRKKKDGRRTRRGDKWREAAGRKMEKQTKVKMREEIESGGLRSDRKDPIICLSGCIMAYDHPTKANRHSAL